MDSRIDVQHLPPDIVQGREQPLPAPAADISLDDRKKRELIQALDQANGNQSLHGLVDTRAPQNTS